MANPQNQTRGGERQTIGSKDVASVNAEDILNGPPEGMMNAGSAPDGWEQEQIGFPPYWNPRMTMVDPTKPRAGMVPGTGNSFLGTVVNRDERDPNFTRYVVQASRAIRCQNGPSDDAEEVIVQKGEFFTLSTYASLPLDDYFGMEVYVQPIGKRKIKDDPETGEPRDLWRFSLMVSPESKKLLKNRREEHTRLLLKAQEEYRLSMIKKDAENPLMDPAS